MHFFILYFPAMACRMGLGHGSLGPCCAGGPRGGPAGPSRLADDPLPSGRPVWASTPYAARKNPAAAAFSSARVPSPGCRQSSKARPFVARISAYTGAAPLTTVADDAKAPKTRRGGIFSVLSDSHSTDDEAKSLPPPLPPPPKGSSLSEVCPPRSECLLASVHIIPTCRQPPVVPFFPHSHMPLPRKGLSGNSPRRASTSPLPPPSPSFVGLWPWLPLSPPPPSFHGSL